MEAPSPSKPGLMISVKVRILRCFLMVSQVLTSSETAEAADGVWSLAEPAESVETADCAWSLAETAAEPAEPVEAGDCVLSSTAPTAKSGNETKRTIART